MRHAFAVVLLMLLVCSGCVRSFQPVLTDDQLIINDALLGQWVEKGGEDLAEIRREGEEKQYRVQYRDKNGKQGKFNMRLGKVGPLVVAEFSPAEPEWAETDVYKAHLIPVYSFVVLEQTEPQVIFSLFDPRWFSNHVKANPNELAVVQRGQDDFLVTAPTAEYQAFILKHWNDPDSRGDKVIYVRPGDPTTKPTTQPVEKN